MSHILKYTRFLIRTISQINIPYFTGNVDSSKSIGLVDAVWLGMVILLLPFSFVTFFSSLYFCFDPYYFVPGVILGDPSNNYVSSTIYIMCLVFRACFVCCAFECELTITLAAMILIQLIDTLQSKFRDNNNI